MTRLALMLLMLSVSMASGQVVVIFNATPQVNSFNVTHEPGGARTGYELARGEMKVVPVGRKSELNVAIQQKIQSITLEPYQIYLFQGQEPVTFSKMPLVGEMPKPDDVPVVPEVKKPRELTVRLLVDDADKRARAAWEKALRQRLTVVSKIMESQLNLQLKIGEVAEWKTDPEVKDLPGIYEGFAASQPAKAGVLQIGFTSRMVTDEAIGVISGPNSSHLLMREGVPRTENEREDALAHYLGQYLGAARVPDSNTVMRPNLRDGKATKTDYSLSYDPVNILIMSIWSDEQRAGRQTWKDLSPIAKARLMTLYKTIAATHEGAKSNEMQAREYVELLGGTYTPMSGTPGTEPNTSISTDLQSVRKVVLAVTEVAVKQSQLKDNDDNKLKRDALTRELIRTAASTALTCEEPQRVKAFLVGLGIALDDTTILRENILTRKLIEGVESDAERKARATQLGTPTIRDRRDHCQHFAVSMALTSLLGAEKAEVAGLAKEVMDMGGPSGFSFADMGANLAGIALAKELIKKPELLEEYAKRFPLEQVAPDTRGLPEGITTERFDRDYKSATDPRFQAQYEAVKKRVDALWKK